MSSAAEQYRRWFAYEQDSHAQVLTALAAVAAELREHESYRQAITLMAHIVAARWLWLARFNGPQAVPTGFAPQRSADFFPVNLSLADLAARVAGMHAGWANYLNSLTDEELARVFEYQSLEGPRFRNTIADILTQLFGHSLYHRGQIAMLLRTIGAEPPITDFVFWAREPVPET
jgi:uncharacterized damage-inducible protein DinB